MFKIIYTSAKPRLWWQEFTPERFDTHQEAEDYIENHWDYYDDDDWECEINYPLYDIEEV